MSKERARRRAAREHEASLRASARAAEAERRERRRARSRTLRRIAGGLPGRRPVGRPTGTLARRRRARSARLLVVLVTINVLVWFATGDGSTRLGALVVSVLAAPVLATLLQSRRR